MESLLINTFVLCATVGMLTFTFMVLVLTYAQIREFLIDEGIIKEKSKNKKDI